jgi:nucleotide-binding universal stress UspA family protein
MIYNTIMVQLDIDGSSTERMLFAWDLAQRFEADLVAFVAAEARIVVPGDDSGLLAEPDMQISSIRLSDKTTRLRPSHVVLKPAADAMRCQIEDIEVRLKALKERFGSVTRDSARASWRGFVGNPTRLLATHARAADLIVVGPLATGLPADHLRTVDVGTLVLSTGRPLLLASNSLELVKSDNVLVAWKDTREARRAVVDAMPFLADAHDVLVITVDDSDSKAARESAADVVRFLTKHGVKARSDVVGIGGADSGEALAQAAREISADLIVAGGYGHSRYREWAFGGVTRSLLRDNSINRLISN